MLCVESCFFVRFCLFLDVATPLEQGLNIFVNKLTDCIVNTVSGDVFDTEVNLVASKELRNATKKKGWNFNWRKEFNNTDRQVYKLTIRGNIEVIQGLVSVSEYENYYYIHLIENAPFNVGGNKLYEGVAGNLFAFVCRLSWDKGYEGFVSFQSKTNLIEHYESSLGAMHLKNGSMVINPHAALKLIKQYFLKEKEDNHGIH